MLLNASTTSSSLSDITQRQEYKLMQKGRTTRLTQDRIDLLNKVNFVWEAQRGGPRRHRRATVSVPPKANPVQKSAKESRGSTPSSAGRGGKGGARGGLTPPAVVARSAPASAPQPSGTGMLVYRTLEAVFD